MTYEEAIKQDPTLAETLMIEATLAYERDIHETYEFIQQQEAEYELAAAAERRRRIREAMEDDPYYGRE